MESDTFITYEPVGMPRLEVRILRDTIWMTMQQMAMVFDVDRSVIGKHIRNIYKTGELVKESTWAKIAQVRCEGKRQVSGLGSHVRAPMPASPAAGECAAATGGGYRKRARTAASMPSTSTTCFCVIGAFSIATKDAGGSVRMSVPNARRQVSGNL